MKSSAPDASAAQAKEPAPKGPVGVSFVPLPVPIASTLPPPQTIEPLAGMRRGEADALVEAATERRRELTENGQVLNRVVYDSMVFVPASTDRVPGGGLLFESRFESGNLRRAVHVNGNEYDLLLNWDHGTRGHTQWFFFSVSGAHVGEKYIFNIVNFCKPQSLCVPSPGHTLSLGPHGAMSHEFFDYILLSIMHPQIFKFSKFQSFNMSTLKNQLCSFSNIPNLHV